MMAAPASRDEYRGNGQLAANALASYVAPPLQEDLPAAQRGVTLNPRRRELLLVVRSFVTDNQS